MTQKEEFDKAIEILDTIEENINICCAVTMEPDEVLELIKKEIILIQQFRAGVISRYDDNYLYEIVAGIIGKNEKPEETALRECEEETGCVVKKITPIHSYFPAPGSSESFYHLFLGEVDSFDGKRIKGLNNENEDILVSAFKVSEVNAMLKNKMIKGTNKQSKGKTIKQI